ncbi:MAG: hypothetical protein KJ573_04045, partial [Proteobacteria bacterium]|nr:hypothetical protein [Pseudomonadota bacterium]
MKNHKEGRSWIRNLPLQLSPPSLKDNTADVDRLIRGIKKGLEAEAVRIDFSLIKRAPQTLRKYDYNVRAAVFQER